MRIYRQRNLRHGRRSVPGGYYFITANLAERVPGFSLERNVEIAVNSLRWIDERRSAEILSYVFMPDHVHLILQLGMGPSLSSVVSSFKKFTSRRFEPVDSRAVSWQANFFDHLFRSGEKIYEKLFYLYWNPVREGLISAFSLDYPHWWCAEPYRSELIAQFPRLQELNKKGRLWAPERK
jgi:REP element-mobilizing transposase RayT